MPPWPPIAFGLAAVLCSAQAIAAPGGARAMPKPMTATLFRDPGFAGPSIVVDATQLFMETPWPVRSMRTRGDGKWQVCSDSLFDGQCMMIARDLADMKVQSGWTGAIGSMRAICSVD
jgi:hypothetical protein